MHVRSICSELCSLPARELTSLLNDVAKFRKKATEVHEQMECRVIATIQLLPLSNAINKIEYAVNENRSAVMEGWEWLAEFKADNDSDSDSSSETSDTEPEHCTDQEPCGACVALGKVPIDRVGGQEATGGAVRKARPTVEDDLLLIQKELRAKARKLKLDLWKKGCSSAEREDAERMLYTLAEEEPMFTITQEVEVTVEDAATYNGKAEWDYGLVVVGKEGKEKARKVQLDARKEGTEESRSASGF